MTLLLLALACSLSSDPATPGSAAATSLAAQVEAGEHARRVTELMEAMEQAMGEPELSEQELRTLRGQLEQAVAEAQKAQDALDRAEAALAQP